MHPSHLCAPGDKGSCRLSWRLLLSSLLKNIFKISKLHGPPWALQCTLDTQSQLSQLVYKQLLRVPSRNWDTVEEGMEDHINTCGNTASVWSLTPSHQSLLPQHKSK